MCQSSSVRAMVVCKRILIGVATSLPGRANQGGHLLMAPLCDRDYTVTVPDELSRGRQPVVPEPGNIRGQVSQAGLPRHRQSFQ